MPSYLQPYLNHCNDGEYQKRSACQNKMRTLSRKTKAFNSSFYSCSIKKWCVLNDEIWNIVSANKFKEIIFSFIRTKELNFCNIWHQRCLLARLRLNFSHLNEPKFRPDFRDAVNPMCKYGLETKTTFLFLLRCRLYSTIKIEFLDDIYTVASSLTNYPDEKLLNVYIRVFWC